MLLYVSMEQRSTHIYAVGVIIEDHSFFKFWLECIDKINSENDIENALHGLSSILVTSPYSLPMII